MVLMPTNKKRPPTAYGPPNDHQGDPAANSSPEAGLALWKGGSESSLTAYT
jgi:hypothetical protein